ncbi:MAG TPA: 3'-5' exonuclease [Candidatus Acidoferrum sp.]|nr:3'-5' exonuclease [Candidatus Acidoferrum sp.]
MEFRIADTFTDSLSRLTAQEQKAVKTTAFDLQLNPASPGMKFHKIGRSKDPNFWSLRVNADIRLVVHKSAASLLLVYVDHHDDAYKWAERRKIERHPTTGAMQLVEIRERIEEIDVPRPKVVESPPVVVSVPAPPKPKVFDNLRKFELMAFGVPAEWVDDVRAADEDTLLDVITHLPQEAQEAILRLAVGEKPTAPKPLPAEADPFSHPDAQRRFRVLTNMEELERALDYPWEKWAVFLHPDQRALVERRFAGPARVSGSAGTGKTIVALHRATFLAREHAGAKVLLTTFSTALANALKARLAHLIGNEPGIAERIDVQPIASVGHALYAAAFGPPEMAPPALVQALLKEAATAVPGHKFPPQFLFGEWTDVVDAWQLKSWEDYRDVSRLGRKTRIGGKQRELLWAIFERVRAGLAARKVVTSSDIFGRLAEHLAQGGERPFDFAVVDEAQDIGVAEARFLAVLGARRGDGLFFAGDLGQRIFQQPFSWKSLGIDIRGRSHTLRINYRTSHQIRESADRLLPSALSDVDGISESRRGTVSVFNGPAPKIEILDSPAKEAAAVGAWIAERLRAGCLPHEIGLFVRAEPQMERARSAVKAAGTTSIELSDTVAAAAGHVAISTMHLAKGLEFRAVAVMACDDGVLPLQERIESVADDSDVEEVYNTERHLLYVACTRARDHLLVTGVKPASEFLGDFKAAS